MRPLHLTGKWRRETLSTVPSSAEPSRAELLPGTLDLIVLQALATMGSQHAYGLAARLEQVSKHPLTLNQGTLYPALVRLEQKGWIKGAWHTTEKGREAKYYSLTRAGTRALGAEAARWRRLSGLVEALLLREP
jgi:PadR family transcriptional regulator PadR